MAERKRRRRLSGAECVRKEDRELYRPKMPQPQNGNNPAES